MTSRYLEHHSGLGQGDGSPVSGCCQSSARLRSSKAGRVSGACAGGAGPPWSGIEDKYIPTSSGWAASRQGHWPRVGAAMGPVPFLTAFEAGH